MTLRRGLATLLLATPLHANPPVSPDTATETVRRDLEAAHAEWNQLRQEISQARLPLVDRLRTLEAAVAERRAEVARLREAAGLERDVMLLGMGNRFELWDTARLAAREAEDLANWRPGAGAGFTF